MRITLALCLVLVPTLAAAQPAPASHAVDSSKMVTDDCARARRAGKQCVLEVTAEDVGGSTPTAGDITVRVVLPTSSASLIHLRRDFIPEIVNSAEDL
jgi:hypothetical protein